ncbi:MAG: hypothetical protein HRT44_13095 [Bdellovibrionales bacterium]|nr:hypothetical protein [Bdellovibrionales bacterium]
MEYNVNFQFDLEHRRCTVGNEPMIFHCNHYNCYLQRTIVEDAPYIDSKRFLIGAAAEVAYNQLSNYFKDIPDVEQRKRKAEEIFRWAGFGIIDLNQLNENGGELKTKVTHYSVSWPKKFGQSTYPVDFFATGWIAGAQAAIYNMPLDSIHAEQTTCVSMGHPENTFVFKKDP